MKIMNNNKFKKQTNIGMTWICTIEVSFGFKRIGDPADARTILLPCPRRDHIWAIDNILFRCV